MGVGWVCGFAGYLFDAYYLGLECRPSVQRPFWNDPGRRRYLHDILAGLYKYWNGDGADAGCWCSIALYQLWRLVDYHHDDLYRPFNERQYAAFHAIRQNV